MPTSNPAEYRSHNRTGSLNIPSANGMMSPGGMPGAAQRFDGPRSPPNTSHVPCKFFRQGACQAGNACPFSHDLSSAAETVCKYFAKGNCKFGPKCANIHVLPDGRRINYGKNGVTVGTSPVALGARVNPTTYHQPSNSALTNSFLRADAVPAYNSSSSYGPQDDHYSHQLGVDNGLPTIDTSYTSNPTSVYGSPRDDDPSRLSLGLSPLNAKGLSVLDAPLPASFDSNGISHAARYGPWPSSVPNKFGLDSPSPSLNIAKDARTSETLKLLHTSAFGSSEHMSPSQFAAMDMNGFGGSPPASTMYGSALNSEEYFGKRSMHSSSQRYAKPRLMSSSAPKDDRDWEAGFLFEEDYVPGTLANEVLTPAEKARRGSTTNTIRPTDNGLEPSSTDSIPMGTAATKFGSPAATGASPSRWGSLWQRQKDDEASLETNSSSYGATGSSRPKHTVSAFGHVGSPLRNSSLANGITAEMFNGDSSSRPGVGSRHASTSEAALSALQQQFQRTRLNDEGTVSGGTSPRLHPNVTRASGGVIGKEREKERALERHVSSGSISSSVTGRFTTPIDEEDASFVFSMEEEDEAQIRARKRVSSSGGNMGMGAASPIGSGWSYASAVASNRNAAGAVNGNGARNGGTVEGVGGR
ncbi:hypothetical protein B0T22DRAFT_194146 [Podospora appendiculata]|uniref:C3H1-type domain-containing protein n=1 Tax=Podospora appendiculata TaxID=314037 RepID=A0AAE0XDL5_9PEZI|nr:hypothetical protein B0T22DRAFT_194146 [Podospora appendiculata]